MAQQPAKSGGTGDSNVVELPSAGEQQDERVYKVSSPYKIVLIGLGMILLAFGGLGIWAATAPLDSASRAPGTVTVESNRKIVNHLDGGVVERIAVEEGDRVREGELLIQLDPTETQARRNSVRHQLDSALARRARLIAERDGLPAISFPAELTERRDESATVLEAIEGERRQFRERRQSVQGRISVQEEKIEQLRDEIAGLRAERSSAERQVEILRSELVDLRKLSDKGFFPKSRILQRERELARLEGQIGSITARMAGSRKSISEARLQIEQIRQEFNEKVVTELRKVEDQIAKLREELTITTAKLKRTSITAPQSGVIHDLRVNTIGAAIQPGKPLMNVIPVEDKLIVEAEVQPRDIDIVSEGQTAKVRMTALQTRTTPVLTGRVVRVSADRITRENSAAGSSQSRSFYKARVEIGPEELKKLGGQKLQNGMPAEVMINTGERTVLDYIVKPLTDAMARGFIEK
jgi:HlyD family secretion protein/epimerase transport system membrane fusion protein